MHTLPTCLSVVTEGLKWLNHNYQQRLRLKSSAHSFPTGFSVSLGWCCENFLFSNCIMSFPYILKSSNLLVLWQISSSRSSWWNKVINYPALLLPSFSPFAFSICANWKKKSLFFSAETTESELCRVFSAYGNVKSTKIIVDRAGVSKGYGFVTFDTPAVIDSLMVWKKKRKDSFCAWKLLYWLKLKWCHDNKKWT